MAVSLGRNAVILVATSSPGTTAVAKHFDGSMDQSLETTDSTTNDSGGSREHEVTFDTGDVTFKVYVDETDSGQNILRDAWEGKTKIFARVRPRGTTSGARQYDFECSVSMKRGTPMNGLATADVTLKRSGAVTASNQ